MTRNLTEIAQPHPFCSTHRSGNDQVLRNPPSISLNELMKCGETLSKNDPRVVQECLDKFHSTATDRCERLIGLCNILDEALEITSDYEKNAEIPPPDTSTLGQ